MSEPREWWIYPVKGWQSKHAAFDATVYDRWSGTGDVIHVIEKSAYDAVVKQNANAVFIYETERNHCAQAEKESDSVQTIEQALMEYERDTKEES